MRLKTPIFLGLIVGSICLFVFLIWPAIGEVQKEKSNLASVQELANTVQKKNQNIESLASQLGSGDGLEGKRFAEMYIPYSRNEEKMTKAFFQLISPYPSMLVGSFSEDDVKEIASNLVAETPQNSAELIFGTGTEADMMTGAPVSSLPTVRISRNKIAVTGNYDDIKALIRRIYALDLMNNITELAVSSVKSDSGAPTNLVVADISTDFNYIPLAKINKDYNNPIFSQNSFNFQPATELKGLLTEKSSEVVFETVERGNPFLP